MYTLAQLKTELADKKYEAYLAKAADLTVAGLLNASSATPVKREAVAAGPILAAIDPAELEGLSDSQILRLTFLVSQAPLVLGDTLAHFERLFAKDGPTYLALLALSTRKGTEAEVLWGTGTVVSATDVGAVRG